MKISGIICCALWLSVLGLAVQAHGETVSIDSTTGAVFDGVLDGFPTIAPFDGTPDFGGNQLGVVLKQGVTEERGIGEFPLAALADVSGSLITNATLSFNIDDVLSTLGPGTDLSGAATREISIYTYEGDGAVALDDYSRTDRAPYIVDTSGHGTITDASLRTSGPLVFTVDVTDDIREALDAGAVTLGVIWRAGDSPTGTSIDNLGDGSLGPPGVNGSKMPFLTITFADEATSTPTATVTPESSPSPTPTRTPEPTRPTRTPGGDPCAGDCDEDGRVVVSELVRAVNMALAGDSGQTCAPVDGNKNGRVSVDELVKAVNVALRGC